LQEEQPKRQRPHVTYLYPASLSCEELMARSVPQLLFTNLLVAALMLHAFYALKEKRLEYSEVYLDIGKNICQPVTRPV